MAGLLSGLARVVNASGRRLTADYIEFRTKNTRQIHQICGRRARWGQALREQRRIIGDKETLYFIYSADAVCRRAGAGRRSAETGRRPCRGNAEAWRHADLYDPGRRAADF